MVNPRCSAPPGCSSVLRLSHEFSGCLTSPRAPCTTVGGRQGPVVDEGGAARLSPHSSVGLRSIASIFLGMWLRYIHFMEPDTSDSQIFFRLECLWYNMTVWRGLASHPLFLGQYQACVIRSPRKRQADSQTHPCQQPSPAAFQFVVQNFRAGRDLVPNELLSI